jgi:hypothetical protein
MFGIFIVMANMQMTVYTTQVLVIGEEVQMRIISFG